VTYAYNKGWLTSVSGASVYQYTGFDGLGRVITGTQTTNSQAYTFQVGYNLANGVKSLTYPFGRVVTTSYDGAGREVGLSGSIANAAAATYVTSTTYAPHGAVSQRTLGNGVLETRADNARLQPWTVTAVRGVTPLLSLTYGYSAGQNNGNVLSQAITQGATSFTQSYAYDQVNRLKTASES